MIQDHHSWVMKLKKKVLTNKHEKKIGWNRIQTHNLCNTGVKFNQTFASAYYEF